MSKYDILVDMTSTLVAREANSQWIVAPTAYPISTTGTAVDAGGAFVGRTLVVDGTVKSSAGNAVVFGAGTISANAGMVAIKPDGIISAALVGLNAVGGDLVFQSRARFPAARLQAFLAGRTSISPIAARSCRPAVPASRRAATMRCSPTMAR